MLFTQFSCNILSLINSLIYRINMTLKPRINYANYIQKKIDKWVILSYFKFKKRIHFLCSCECGENSIIQASALIYGNSKSCKNCAPKKHGYYGTPTNRAWSSARNRCNNQNNKDYIHYGARGIRMCKSWDIFENFLADMGEKPKGLTLDRINNNGNYEPGNCRWATYSQQNSNQRKRSAKIIITGGN